MSAVPSPCSHCGSPLEADCTFCPDCGSPRARRPVEAAPQPYNWMNDQRPGPQLSRKVDRTSQPPVTYYAPSPQVVRYEPAAAATANSSGLASVGMTMGIITACLMIIGLVPCLGWMNWLVLFVGGITNILNWVVIFTDRTQSGRNKAIIGLVLTFVALFIGFIRLAIGGGCV